MSCRLYKVLCTLHGLHIVVVSPPPAQLQAVLAERNFPRNQNSRHAAGMSARAHKGRTTSLFHLLLICVVLTPRSIVSPTDLEAPASHKAAQPSDSPTRAAISPEETTTANNVGRRSNAGGAEVTDSLRSSSNVGAEAANEPLSDFAALHDPASGGKSSIHLSSLSETVGTSPASGLPGKVPGLAGGVASTLIGHVVNVSQQASNHSSNNVTQAVAAPEVKPVQPPQAETPAKKPEEDEERHNFALAKDGAKIVAANKEARKPESVLDSDGDTFLKNECKADKWILIELSQVTKIDMIRLSQDELYSSRISDFEVYGRQNHPRAEGPDYGSHLNASAWQLLGSFTAANTKGTQAFHIDPPGWAKYMQLRLRTHYGNEPVCALNDVRVYGKSAAEDLEDRLAMEAAADEEAAAEEECSLDEGSAQESSQEPQHLTSRGEGGVREQAQISEATTGSLAEEPRPQEKGTELMQEPLETGVADTEPAPDARAPQKEHSSEGAGSLESREPNDTGQLQPVSGGPKASIPPVLDILGEGLMRLIVPPGAGKRRSAYSGEPTDPHALPQPDPPVPAPDIDRPEQTGGGPANEAVGHGEGVQSSAVLESTAVGPKDAMSAKPASGSVTSVASGSKKQDEGTSSSNGSRKAQKEDRSTEKDGDLLLAGSSAGSVKSRHGGSVYDLLVAEIKALKLQQKTVHRIMGDMQKNVTLAVAAIASEVSALHRRVSEIEDSAAVPSATCAAALPGSGDGQIRVYPNSTAEQEPQHTLAHADSHSGPVTVSFDAMALALELAALRSASDRASRREFALAMVIAMLCTVLALSLPQLASQRAWLRSVILLLAVANGFFGILLHFANSLQPEKSMFTHMHRLLGA